jgi:1-acyl-sn-glycerol-3-phosphate acyltransferase
MKPTASKMRKPAVKLRKPAVKLRKPAVKVKRPPIRPVKVKMPPIKMAPAPLRPFYHFSWIPLTLFMLVLCRRKVVRDVTPLPKAPVMVVANHMSHYDIISLALAVYPLKLSFMAKEELFRTRFLRILVTSLGSFPVHRGGADRRALRKANQVLQTNWALAVFPEGTRSPEKKLIRGHEGSALLALRNDVLILPVGIAGTDKIADANRGIWGLLFHRPLVTIHVGKPFKLPQPEGKLTREHLQESADNIMRHVAELIPKEYRGVYGED